MPKVSKKPNSGRIAGGLQKRHRRKPSLPRSSSPQLKGGQTIAAILSCVSKSGHPAVEGSPGAAALGASHSQRLGLAPDTPMPTPMLLGKRKRADINYKEMDEDGLGQEVQYQHHVPGVFKKHKTSPLRTDTGRLCHFSPPRRRRQELVPQLDALAPVLLEMVELISSCGASNSTPEAVSVDVTDKHNDSEVQTGAEGGPIAQFQELADIKGARALVMISQTSSTSTSEEAGVCNGVAHACNIARCPPPHKNTTGPKTPAKKATNRSCGRPRKSSA